MIQPPSFVDGSVPWKEQEQERRQNFLLLFHEKQNKQKPWTVVIYIAYIPELPECI